MTEPGCGASVVHVPATVDPPERTVVAARMFTWFTAAAVTTWMACGLWPIAKIIDGAFNGRPATVYVAAFVAYGAALIGMLVLPRRRRRPPVTVPIALLAIQTVTGVTVNLVTALHLQGTGVGIGLLVITAAQLPYVLSSRITWIWIVLQTTSMMWGIGGFAPQSALGGVTFLLAAIAFQVFAAASTILALSEGRARTNLARVNTELTATRELLAESSRTSERLRISRDLHDTLGHHLTALSLQLDVAARLSDGKAGEHIQQAHAITRLLLSDVRNVVSTLRETSRMNLAGAIRALAVQPAGARVHLDIPETLVVDDVERAEAILRAIQEVLTNTARHAQAANLWIRLTSSVDGITLDARDDGRGAASVDSGNGLRGMRERFAHYGGRVDVTPSNAPGFHVHAFMPIPSAT